MKISKCKQLIHFEDENLDSLKNKENANSILTYNSTKNQNF